MSSFKPLLFGVACTVMLAPSCAKTPQPAVESPVTPVASAAACDGAVFQEKCVHKGDTVTFGNYPQATETPEPIEWIVLDIDASKGQILFLSKYVLDAKPYHTEYAPTTWENSTLRSWLNDTFKTTAFTSSEQQQIALTPIENPNNPHLDSTNGGIATNDYVFLLSVADAANQTERVAGSGKYFSSDEERQADATRYAVQNGVGVVGSESHEYSDDGTCTDIHCFAVWWIRWPDDMVVGAAVVDGGGSIRRAGLLLVINMNLGVRPALWVKY